MIRLPSNFDYRESEFLTERESCYTLETLKNLPLSYYPQGFVIYVNENKSRYILDTTGSYSSVSGYWKKIKDGIKIYSTIAELVADTENLEDGKLAICIQKDYYGIWQYKANEEVKETIGKWRQATNTSSVSVNDVEKETNEGTKDFDTQAKINIDNVDYFKATISQFQKARTYAKNKLVWYKNKLWESQEDYNKGNEPIIGSTYWKCVYPFNNVIYKILGTSLIQGVDNEFTIEHNLSSTLPIVRIRYKENGEFTEFLSGIIDIVDENKIKFTIPKNININKLVNGTIYVIVYDGGNFNEV